MRRRTSCSGEAVAHSFNLPGTSPEPDAGPRTFVLTLRDLGDPASRFPRLRKLLKATLRAYGYRCDSLRRTGLTVFIEPSDLLADLRRRGFSVRAEGDDDLVVLPAERLTAGDRECLAASRGALLDLLAQADDGPAQPPSRVATPADLVGWNWQKGGYRR